MTYGKWRVGIVGGRGEALLAGLRAVPEAEVVAFCEQDEQRLHRDADHYNIPLRFARFDALLDAVDVVVIATPMQLHVPQSILALQAGKHVLSEVTAAVSLDECWLLLDAVNASGKTYMLAENVCYWKENVIVREMARKGLFGELYFGEGEYLHEVRSLHHTADGSPTWRYYWQVGVNGCTYGTHSLGPLMQWFTAINPNERIDTVTCLGSGRHTDPEHPQDDTNLMLCKLKSGKLIKIRLDMMSNRPYSLNYTLQGTQGVYESARVQGEPGRVWIGENRVGEHRSWRSITEFEEHLPQDWQNLSQEAREAGHGGSDYHTGRLFLEAIVRGEPSPIGIYDALEWTAAGLCSQVSIDNGGVSVRVPDFRDPTQRPLVPPDSFRVCRNVLTGG